MPSPRLVLVFKVVVYRLRKHDGDARFAAVALPAVANGCMLTAALLKVRSSSASAALTERPRCVLAARTLDSAADSESSSDALTADAV